MHAVQDVTREVVPRQELCKHGIEGVQLRLTVSPRMHQDLPTTGQTAIQDLPLVIESLTTESLNQEVVLQTSELLDPKADHTTVVVAHSSVQMSEVEAIHLPGAVVLLQKAITEVIALAEVQDPSPQAVADHLLHPPAQGVAVVQAAEVQVVMEDVKICIPN